MTTTLTTSRACAAILVTGCSMALSMPALAGRAELQNDLFARPVLSPPESPRAATPAEPVAAATASADTRWNPALRAIVLAGTRSMVLVDRSVVELGGKIDGYELIRVDDDKAVFTRGHQRVELTLGRRTVDAR